MHIEPAYQPARHIIRRWKRVDREAPVIGPDAFPEFGPPAALNPASVRQQIEDAVQYSVQQLPAAPTIGDTNRVLAALARNVDQGGRLHATILQALNIPRPASLIAPLPALPSAELSATTALAPRSRREIAVLRSTHDAVAEALKEFRAGVLAAPYHIDTHPHENALFLGDVRARQAVYDVLDAAKRQLVVLRARTAQFDETALPNLHDTEITDPQLHILRSIARGFVTDLVRGGQTILRTAGIRLTRDAALQDFVAGVMQKLAVTSEPLRFATAWIADEHYPQMQRLVSELPAFREPALQGLAVHGPLIDRAVVSVLREAAYPREAAYAHIDEALASIERNRPLLIFERCLRGVLASAALFFHAHPERHPVAAARGIIRSRLHISAVLAYFALAPTLRKIAIRSIVRHQMKPHISPPALPERTLYDALRAAE